MRDGSAAALIICADKGFSTTKDPVETFAQLVSNTDVTVFVTDRGIVSANYGSLTGTPEDMAPLDGHRAVFGPIELDGSLHEGALFQLSKDQKLITLDNEPIEAPEAEEPEVDAAPFDMPSDEVDVPADPVRICVGSRRCTRGSCRSAAFHGRGRSRRHDCGTTRQP